MTPVIAVVIGRDGAEVGAGVADLERRGWRAAGFVGDPATQQPALVEMLAELFPMALTPESVEPA
jgi:hypothetical protein